MPAPTRAQRRRPDRSALRPCPACGHTVAKTAETCPNCGAPLPGPARIGNAIASLLAAAAFAYMAWVLFDFSEALSAFFGG